MESALRNSRLDVVNKMPTNSWDFNLDYLHVIKPQKEFSISTLYSRTNSNSSFTRNPIANSEGIAFENLNNSRNQEFTLQTDYMTPIKKNQIFEVGNIKIKVLHTPGKGNGRFSTVGDLAYNQNIGAGYASYTYSSKTKYTF